MVGWAKDYTGSFAGGLYALAGFALMSAVISALWLRIPNPVRQEMAGVPAERHPKKTPETQRPTRWAQGRSAGCGAVARVRMATTVTARAGQSPAASAGGRRQSQLQPRLQPQCVRE
jgi:hypothetical protein